MLRALCHSEATGWTEVKDLSSISELRTDDESLVWAEVEVSALNESAVATIQEELSLDPLAVEDALDTRQRPKIESYDNHAFAVLHELYQLGNQLEPRQISCFMGEHYLLVIHEDATDVIEEAHTRLRESQPRSAAHLLHILLDCVVDDYEKTADRLEDDVESLEERFLRLASMTRIPKGEEIADERHLYTLKQRTARLRRYALPLDRVLQHLSDPELNRFVDAATARELRDVHDHVIRMGGQTRNIDELLQAALDLIRGEQANTLNETNKKLTAWAAIIAVPTFIASVYGMNFHLYPTEGTAVGFWFAIATMAASALGLYVFFRRRGWVGATEESRRSPPSR